MNQQTHQRIGELNGPWAKLFKFSQIFMPVCLAVIVPFCLWIVKDSHTKAITIAEIQTWMRVGPRFTATDGEALRLRMQADSQAMLDSNLKIIAAQYTTMIERMTRVETKIEEHMKQLKP